LIDNFTWTFQHNLPANRILSFGCGNGGELFFIRDKYPNAIIDAVDWEKKVPDSVLNQLKITFFEANVYDYLDSHKFTYDFIYSSHTLEHSYRVQTLLDLLYQSLIPDGLLTGNLPLCAFGDTKYALFLKKVLNDKSQKLRQLDCGLLDFGHPWKTNEVDLYYSLRDVGFHDIKIYGNSSRCVRGKSVTPSQWEKAANFKFLLSSATLGLLKKTLYLFFSDPCPYFLTKLYFAIDTRLPIGGVRIANFVPEVFFVAQKPAYGKSVLNDSNSLLPS
jgi:SAM-dependent methyltransferase